MVETIGDSNLETKVKDPAEPKWTESQLAEIVDEARQNVQVADRKYHLKTWPKCFIATELTDWLIKSGHAKDTEEAIELGVALVDNLFIVHVNRDHNFKNEMLFFRFFEDERDYGHVRRTKDKAGETTYKTWKKLLDGPHAGKEISPEDLKQLL